jgi:multiple sugar transport system permease protein
MILSSFKTSSEIMRVPLTFFPEKPTFVNYQQIVKAFPIILYYFNSFFVAAVQVFIILFTSSLLGYIFAKFEFQGRNLLFVLFLVSFMVPFQSIMVPLYIVLLRIKLINTYPALIFPGMISAYGIFLMRQFAYGIPSDLIDAARIDGCSEFGIYIRIILPVLKPVLALLGVFTFMWNWNAYLWPLIAISSGKLRTLPLGLAALSTQYTVRYDLIMAGTAIASIPIILIFLYSRKHFIRSFTLSGLKM